MLRVKGLEQHHTELGEDGHQINPTEHIPKKHLPARLKEGLSGNEIRKIIGPKSIYKVPGFIDVYHHDELKTRFRKDLLEELSPVRPTSFIINTGDKDALHGEHYQAVWIGPTEDEFCRGVDVDFFDSYGEFPYQEDVIETIKYLLDICFCNETYHFDYNMKPVQNINNPDSITCGYHCCYFLINKNEFRDITLNRFIKTFYYDDCSICNDNYMIDLFEYHL